MEIFFDFLLLFEKFVHISFGGTRCEAIAHKNFPIDSHQNRINFYQPDWCREFNGRIFLMECANCIKYIVFLWCDLFIITVASRVGAWIEIVLRMKDKYPSSVASRVGAWIEIQIMFAMISTIIVASRVD